MTSSAISTDLEDVIDRQWQEREQALVQVDCANAFLQIFTVGDIGSQKIAWRVEK